MNNGVGYAIDCVQNISSCSIQPRQITGDIFLRLVFSCFYSYVSLFLSFLLPLVLIIIETQLLLLLVLWKLCRLIKWKRASEFNWMNQTSLLKWQMCMCIHYYQLHSIAHNTSPTFSNTVLHVSERIYSNEIILQLRVRETKEIEGNLNKWK